MEIIKIHHPYQKETIPTKPVVLALGFFDGVHKGHRTVISRAKKMAEEKNVELALMTFNQHPSIVFKKINPEAITYLSTTERKEEFMAELGVDYLYEVDFTSSFAALTPQDFVDQYIIGLHAVTVVAGFDYTYGKKEIASMEHLPGYAKGKFDVVEVGKVTGDGEKISSTRIRKALVDGDIAEANDMLGYIYQTPGIVIHGDARGRLLGYPTANIDTDSGIGLPKVGVYAVRIKIGKTWHEGMASIGYNITFEANRQLSVEVNIFDFNSAIYGEKVSVEWHEYIREEKKFPSVEALIAQLAQDEIDVRNYFKQLDTTKN
ncbi:riboflavin biosynthesis protein RibF [Desemzia sp. FAM 23991]|uniref:riboflavin biosynthesis protein RibF n=1 Tax=unclassified Desemzia TaxID=2685243 RepID=UPI00388735A4